MPVFQKITPHLWFDDSAEEAVRFYTTVFDDSEIMRVTRYGEAGFEIHHMPAGTVMTVDFRIAGQHFIALNGVPGLPLQAKQSLFLVSCEDQVELDYYWERLGEGGDPSAQQCGWLRTASASRGKSCPASLTISCRGRTPHHPSGS